MVLCNISCDLDPKVKVKGQLIYFLENALSPKPLDVATSIGHLKLKLLVNISCDLDPNVKVNSQYMYFL